jgi:hypothetical protein
VLRPSRLRGDELGVQRVRQAGDDFVLHVEASGERLVEPLGPEMIARFGVDELHVDAHTGSAALHAAFEDVADVQLAPDRLHIEPLAFVGEGRVPGDHLRTRNPRQVARQALRDPTDERLLFRTTAEIVERQDDNGEPQRAGFFLRMRGCRTAARTPTSSE